MIVNAACPAANEIAAGASPANRTTNGSSTHSTVVSVPIAYTIAPPTMKPATVPASARNAFWPVLSAVERSTARVPNDDPEAVLDAAQVGDEDRQAERHRAPEAVVQPRGAEAHVRAESLLRGRQRAREPGRLAAEEPVDPAATRGGRREARRWSRSARR